MDYRAAQLLIDYGRGLAGQILGSPCTVYRVQANGAVNYLDEANQVFSGIRMARRQVSKKDLLEAPVMGGIFYTLLANATPLEVGDVIVENDPFYGEGGTEVDFSTAQFEAYLLVYHGPFKQTIAFRIDRTCSIYTPVDTPSPNTAAGAWLPTTSQMAPVVLEDGEFSIGDLGATPTQIPVGITSQIRGKRDLFKGLPGTTETLTYFGVIPALPGWTPKEGDRVVTDGNLSTGSRYLIQHPYTQQAGAACSQLVMSRETAAP